jgi:NadR type nicotinamide-nucleotide adenylyltransferase
VPVEPQLICLIGAECTGKTTLAQALARQMGGLWVPEYLRTFTDTHGRTPRQDEQAHILQEQLRLEDDALKQARQRQCPWVFCDTAPLLTAVYSDCVFGDTSQYPEALVLHRRYAHTLLLEPDIPWVADGLQRDGEAMRAAVHARLQATLSQAGLAYTCIAGDATERLRTATETLNG